MPLVAPYMGAWIETNVRTYGHLQALVAPYMGAWIETWHWLRHIHSDRVAPYMGAWIETARETIDHALANGRSLHGGVD